jgi:hypothetical protein
MPDKITFQPSEKMDEAINNLCTALKRDRVGVIRLALSILVVHVEAEEKGKEIIIRGSDTKGKNEQRFRTLKVS